MRGWQVGFAIALASQIVLPVAAQDKTLHRGLRLASLPRGIRLTTT
jgi:hypothetical protein